MSGPPAPPRRPPLWRSRGSWSATPSGPSSPTATRSRWFTHTIDCRIDGFGAMEMELSSIDVRIIQAIGKGDTQSAMETARALGWLEEGPKGLRPNRERDELAKKLALLNLPIPWRMTNL